MADRARPWARQAARARTAGGSVQGQESDGSGKQKLEAPGGALGRRNREREAEVSQPASARL